MTNVNDNYTTIREAVNKKMLSERDCVYAIYLLAIIVKKMLYDSKGGGHFNISPDTVLVSKKDEEDVKVRLLGDDNPHAACNGKPDFDTKELKRCCRAPESFLGRFTPATDVYAMGVLLAYMLSGTYPRNSLVHGSSGSTLLYRSPAYRCKLHGDFRPQAASP